MRILLFAILLTGVMALSVQAAGNSGKGEEIYKTICSACHGPDANKDGPLGPKIAGAAKDLVEARVMRAQYPPGYKPQRDTKTMPPFPMYKDNIDDIVAYLAKVKK